MQLIVNSKINDHVSFDTVNEFEKVILSDSSVKSARQINKFTSNLLFLTLRLSKKLKLPIYQYLKLPNISFLKFDSIHFFAVLMGLETKKCLPHFLVPFRNKAIYIFDAWEQIHGNIERFVSSYNVGFVFCSALKASELLKKKLKISNVYWIPEGINPEEYTYYAYEDKNIDVLALGRKYNLYHHMILDILCKNEKIYIYEKVNGEIIFPTREGFIEGLGRSKISICFPSSITHPDRGGDIETMTIRYLQSMVSKCLVLGHAPTEMISLFGYNPVVEIDIQNPEEQLIAILNNFKEYIPLIEKNYEIVIHNHTWLCRYKQIKEILKNKSMGNDLNRKQM